MLTSLSDMKSWLLGLAIAAAAIGAWMLLARLSKVRDPDIERRGDSLLLGMRVRLAFAGLMRPVAAAVDASGLPANAITTLSLMLALGAGVAVAAGEVATAGWVYMLAGICDFLDGRLARRRGSASPAGAALDSVVDRYADAALIVGLAWLYRDSWLLLVALVALVGTLLISYVRARGEGLGVEVKVGLMQRPERVALLVLMLILGGHYPTLPGIDLGVPFPIVGAGLVLIAIATQITAGHRALYLFGALRDPSRSSNPYGRLPAALVSSALATALDFACVVALVELTDLAPWAATGLGAVCGAAFNFGLNRAWTFNSRAPVVGQAGRYAIVSSTSALLNSGGVAALMLLPAMDYRPAWWLVRAVVFLCWNFSLQRDWVYADRAGVVRRVRERRHVAPAGPMVLHESGGHGRK